MKKLGICLVLFVLGAACFAQANNDTQRILGTWSGSGGGANYTFTFNSNGTYSLSGAASSSGNFIISGSKILFENFGQTGNNSVLDYYFSADGRQLVLFFAGDGWCYWARKQ